MRAMQISELSGPEALTAVDLPDPEPSHFMTPGEGVVIDVKAAAVSFPDVLQSRGLYQFKPPLPFVPGAEVSGEVVSASPDVQRARVLKRAGMTQERLDSILERQMPDQEKRARADFVIDTSGDLSTT